MTTTISIPEGTIVGRMTGDKVTPVTLAGSVYVEAYRDYDGSWVYSVGKQQYCCAGGLATVRGGGGMTRTVEGHAFNAAFHPNYGYVQFCRVCHKTESDHVKGKK